MVEALSGGRSQEALAAYLKEAYSALDKGTWGPFFIKNQGLKEAFGVEAITSVDSKAAPVFTLLYGMRDNLWYRMAGFYMARFPGLCGAVIVSDRAWGVFDFTNERSDALIKAICYTGYWQGYTQILTSETPASSEAKNELLAYKRCGFKPILKFVNRRTSNAIEVLAKELNKE